MRGRFPKVPGKDLPDRQPLFEPFALDAPPVLVRFVMRRALVQLPRLIAEYLSVHPGEAKGYYLVRLLYLGILDAPALFFPFRVAQNHDLASLPVLDLPPYGLSPLLDVPERELLFLARDTPIDAILNVTRFGHDHVNERRYLEVDLHGLDYFEGVEERVPQ